MSTDAHPKSSYPVDFGLPPRPQTASTPLWDHLLRPKNRAPTLTNMPIIAPPLGPLDKNATSMRILLHDTQANFEKFAKHVGQLFDEVKEAKNEIKATHCLFERDRESLMGDIIDLVNRSQKEIQKSIGTPSQHDFVEILFKDVNHRLSGLDQRLDAIQSFNQTHTQALQTQIQAVQILLDKQGSILAAVLPVLPLLQAVPLHIDAAKASLNEILAKLLLSQRPTSDSIATVAVKNLAVSSPVQEIRKRKRADVETSSISNSPTLSARTPHKKARMEDISKDSASRPRSTSKSETSIHQEDPIGPLSSPLKGQDPSRRNKYMTELASGVSPSTVDRVAAFMSSGSRRGTFAIPTFATPRRPLGDLPIPASLQSSRRNPSLFNHTIREVSLERSNTLASAFSMTGLPGLTPTTARPPRIHRVHTSLTNNAKRAHPVVSTAHPTPGTSANASHTKAGHMPDMHSFTGNPQPSFMSGACSKDNIIDKGLDSTQNPCTKPETLRDSELQSFQNKPPTLPSASFRSPSIKPRGKSASVPLVVTLGKLKDRRSPAREGRRFIPLVDSEDEEEEGT